MSFFKTSKILFEEILPLNSNNREKGTKKETNLEKIDEVSENTISSIFLYDTLEQHTENIISQTIPPYLPNEKFDEFFHQFLVKLTRYKKIFGFFVAEAKTSKIILKKPILSTKFEKLQNINKLNLNETTLVSSELEKSDSNSDSSLSVIEIPKSKSTRRAIFYKKPTKTKPKIIESPITPSSTSSSFNMPYFSHISKLRTKVKKYILRPDNSSVRDIFKTICEGKPKIHLDDFRKFLNLRYPPLVSDTMCKYFHFKNSNFEEYFLEMNKFVASGEERHVNFCFDIFDFNKDKLITYSDTFVAMELRKDNYYDSDLVLIKEMFLLKQEGKLDNLSKEKRMKRRRSTFSLLKNKNNLIEVEKSVNKTPESQKKIDLGISLKEFSIIKFNGRPQIFQDFLIYTCNFNFLLEKGYIKQIPRHSPKNSETIVMEMNLNGDYNEKMRKSEKYEYFCELDHSMRLFDQDQLSDMLKKFSYLQSDEKLKYRVITKLSMINKLVKFI